MKINVKKLTLSAVTMALYVCLMVLFQSISFLQAQSRIATALYALSYMFPFLSLPLAFSNMLSNILLGGLGPLDWFGGLFVGLLTTMIIVILKKLKLPIFLAAVPIVLIPGLIVPLYLSKIINVPYFVLAPSVLLGQVLPSLIGVFLVDRLSRIDAFRSYL